MELLVFGIFGVIALGCGLGVILARNPVHCAIYLLGTLFSVAGMFATLWAEFLAVVQLLVYAGGIMVLFLFVIMLVDLEQRGLAIEAGRIANRIGTLHRWLWGSAAGVLAIALGMALSRAVLPHATEQGALMTAMRGPFAGDGAVVGNVEYVGQLLYTSYLLPFELASVLLLVAMIGAIVVARRED